MGTKKNVERMKRRMGTILRRNAKLETKRHVNFIKRNVERRMVRRIVKLLPRNARLETISHVNSTKKNAKEVLTIIVRLLQRNAKLGIRRPAIFIKRNVERSTHLPLISTVTP